MKSFLSLVVLVACMGVILGTPLRGHPRKPFAYRDIRRIRARHLSQSRTQEADHIASPTLSVLSHLAQTKALRPRRRSFSPRIGHKNLLSSESKDRQRQLPLEPPPQPLPLEKPPMPSLATFQRNPPSPSPPQNFAAYRPRPERGPQRIHRPTVFEPNQRPIEPQEQLPHHHESFHEDRLNSRPHGNQRPLVYQENGMIYRKPIETPSLNDKLVEYSPVHNQDNPIPYQENTSPGHGPPIYTVKTPLHDSRNPIATPPRKTRHRNRPQYSEEYHEVHTPEISQYQNVGNPDISQYQDVREPDLSQYQDVRKPDLSQHQDIHKPDFSQYQGVRKPDLSQYQDVHRPDLSQYQGAHKPEVNRIPPQIHEDENIYFTNPETFESTREKGQVETFVHPKVEEIKEDKNFGPVHKESVLVSNEGRFRSQKPSLQFNKRVPIKVFKKKKATSHNVLPLSKDFKKDKRAILGGHLDKNGIEFVEEASKIEKGRGRMAFQIHGQQGPHSYKFGYDTGKGFNRQFRFEERDGYGEVKGRYGYYGKDGKLHVINYSAHPKHGFSADVPKY